MLIFVSLSPQLLAGSRCLVFAHLTREFAFSFPCPGYSNAAYVSSYSYDDSSSSAGPLFFVLPIVSGVIFGIVFLVRRWQLQQQSALVTSIEPEATRIVGYPGAVPMVPAPIAGVAMHERNVVTTKTYSAGANAPVPIGYAHTGNQSQHQQQYQPYGGAFGVPVQQQQPMHGTPTQYMHHPGQQQQQPLPYSNSQLPSAIPAFFSPGDTNAQQPPQPQPNQSYSDSLPGQVASSNSAVNGTSFAPAPPASYAFATPAGSFAPSAPPLPPAYSAESHDPAYISNAQIGQEYVSQPPPPSYL